MISDLERAQQVAAELRQRAQDVRSSILERIDLLAHYEHQASIIDGYILGIQRGLSGLNAFLEQSTPPISPSEQPNEVVELANQLTTESTLRTRGPRAPRGVNESLVLGVLVGKQDGLGAKEIREAILEQHGISLADSSCRLALQRLEAAEKVISLDWKWYAAPETKALSPSPSEAA